MGIIDSVSNGFSWIWNGLDKFFSIVRWTMKEAKRVVGVAIVTIMAIVKASYDAVVEAMNDVLSELDKIELSSSVSGSVSDFLEFANAMFPLSECLSMLVILIHLAVSCLIIRAIRSVFAKVLG